MNSAKQYCAACFLPRTPPISKVASGGGISEQTLLNWLNKAKKTGTTVAEFDLPADKWSTQDKFLIVVEMVGMSEADLAGYARKKGLYVDQIKGWRDACMNANGGIAKEASRLHKELKAAECEKHRLEKERARKEKALAEAAVLRNVELIDEAVTSGARRLMALI